MSWCPFAVRMELQPESDSQAAITPTQFIVHSLAAPWSIERTYEFWKNSTNLESHFGLGYDGRLGQYIGTNTRADANASANVRAISLESAANTSNTDPWTDDQINTLVKVMDWAADEHNIPRRRCRSWTDPGFGYHRLHPEWSTGGTYCPGDARVKQFNEIVLPRLIAGDVEETHVALTQADIDAVALATANKLIAGGGVLETTDVANVATATTARLTAAGGVLDTIRIQGAANGSSLTAVASSLAAAHGKLDAIKTILDAVDLSDLPEDVAAKLNGLRFVLQEGV